MDCLLSSLKYLLAAGVGAMLHHLAYLRMKPELEPEQRVLRGVVAETLTLSEIAKTQTPKHQTPESGKTSRPDIP